MKDDEKTKEQLIDELTNLRQQVNQLKKATEKEQGKSFDEFKAIFENISDGIVLLTATGKVLKVNQRILEVGGYSKKEIIGKRFIYLKMFPLKCRLQMAARFGKEMAGIKTPPIEVEVYTKTGEKLDIEIYGSVFKMGGRKKVSVAILRDISERKKAEEKLKEYSNHLEQEVKDRTLELRNANQKLRREIKKHRQAEKNMEVLFEFAPDCYYINDLKGHFINGNKAAEELIGYPREEMIGKSFLKLKLLHPKDIPRAASRLAQNLIGRATGPDEFRIIRKDGREIIIETRAHPINIEGKSMVLGIARDITARKQQEKELEDYRLHLEEMVEKRSAQLSEANEKLVLSEKMDAIGQLAGGVAHDLNNILTAMVSYPDLVLMKLPEDSPVRNQILVVKQAGLKAAAIVEDLLTLARRGVRMSEVLNLNDLVSEYLVSPEHKQLQSSHPHVKISPHLDNDLFNIEGSAIHIGKSIMNLVTNASEAAPVKGSIKLSTANLYVDKPVKCFNSNIKKGNYVVLKVSDNGIGIAPEYLEKIFEPFYTKKKMGQSGTGLGMPVVWWTMADHNGYIDVKSKEGKGTTFELFFPATTKKRSVKQPFPTIEIERMRGNGEKILVVDDEMGQREVVSMLLTRLGYSVDVAESGEKAIGYVETNPVDLLILDMIMDGGIDGLDTYREIIKRRPGTKAIIVSGFTETERVKEVLQLGASEFVKKPYTLDAIGKAVKNILQGSQ